MKEQQRIINHFKGVIDSTLREGLQFSGANFSLEEQKKIFRFLSRIGVDYAEVGNPAKSEVGDMIRHLLKTRNGGTTKILSHIRNHPRDLIEALECGVDGVNILCTADPERIKAMDRSPKDYIRHLEQNIVTAQANRLEIRISVEDYFHQSRSLSREVYDTAARFKVERLGLADTLGSTLNWEVYRQIRSLRHRYSLDIEGHFHNDLGHAVSNAMTALTAGANWIDASLLGIGERTGITPLSSLLINLFLLDPGIADRYNLSLLTEAENYVSKICRIETPLNLMTNRRNGFAHKAGIHLDAMLRFGPHKYEFLSPHVVGNGRHLVIGSLISGKTSAREAADFEKRLTRMNKIPGGERQSQGAIS